MAEAEKEAQKKLNQRTKFEHAQKYRKARDKRLNKYCKKYQSHVSFDMTLFYVNPDLKGLLWQQ